MVPETNMPVRFYLSPNREDGSASILVSEPLDYETTPIFSLRVRAQNVAAVPLAAFTTVYINITGVICTLLKWLLLFDMKLKLEQFSLSLEGFIYILQGLVQLLLYLYRVYNKYNKCESSLSILVSENYFLFY